MRAIIPCQTRVSQSNLHNIFDQAGWLSSLSQEDPLVLRERDSILDLVAEEDKPVVGRTFWFMIYHNETKSWGLVNAPTTGTIEFRLKNRAATELRSACE